VDVFESIFSENLFMLFDIVCCNLERLLEFIGSRFNERVNQFDYLGQKISLTKEFSKDQN
jgi:hypothetical protein